MLRLEYCVHFWAPSSKRLLRKQTAVVKSLSPNRRMSPGHIQTITSTFGNIFFFISLLLLIADNCSVTTFSYSLMPLTHTFTHSCPTGASVGRPTPAADSQAKGCVDFYLALWKAPHGHLVSSDVYRALQLSPVHSTHWPHGCSPSYTPTTHASVHWWPSAGSAGSWHPSLPVIPVSSKLTAPRAISPWEISTCFPLRKYVPLPWPALHWHLFYLPNLQVPMDYIPISSGRKMLHGRTSITGTSYTEWLWTHHH